MKTHYGNCSKLMECYKMTSILEGKYSEDVEFTGNGGVYVDDIVTYPLNDYDDTASDRYGTAHEVSNHRQLILLDFDKAYNLTVDKKNLQETGLLKQASRVVEAEFEEQVKPFLEKLTLKRWAEGAGSIVGTANAPTSSTILGLIASAEVAMDNARVPKANRFCAVANTYLPAIRQALTNCDNITDKWLVKGIIGMIGTFLILPVPDGDMPVNAYLLCWQKDAVIAPKTIEDAKTHIDPPGLSGAKLEGRFRGTARVKGKKAKSVYTLVNSSYVATAPSAPTKGATYTTFTIAANHTAKYTLDGSDPRYSVTAKDYSATAIANPAVGTVIKICTSASGKYDSSVVEHTCA